MNKEVKRILSSLKIDGKSIDVAHLRYKGENKTFVTWTMLPERPSLNGDDQNLASIVEVDIDIYSDLNYLDILQEIKKIMKENEWIWTGDSEEMYEEETSLYHRTSTFEKERVL